MITPGKNRNEAFSPERMKTDEQENAELFQFDKTGNLSVRYLRESYNAAKARASELNTNAGLSGNLRSHCQQTIRVYSALATLLYSTISISKADDLERFIRKRSMQVPNSLFDIDEWKPVLQIARNVRMGESGKYLDELGAFKSFMKLRLERILAGSRMVVNEYKKLKTDTAKELGVLKSQLEDFRYKVIPYLQQKMTKVEDDNYKLTRDNKVLSDAIVAKDVEIKELARAKGAQEREHGAHVERVKKESFEAIAFAKSKLDTQQSAHRSEVSSLTRQHEAKLEDMRQSFATQLQQSASASKEIIDRLSKEREWLQTTHAAVLGNAEKIQQQFKTQCDLEVERLERRYAEAQQSASSRLASESSNTQQLLQSAAAAHEAKLSAANAAREYESSMWQVKLQAAEESLRDARGQLEKAQRVAEDLAAKLHSNQADVIASRSEIMGMRTSMEHQRAQFETAKDANNVEFERLRAQLDALLEEKTSMTSAIGSLTAERDESLAGRAAAVRERDVLERKEEVLRREFEEQTRVVVEMESEKCRLMSYYDEKCVECTAQKKELAVLLQAQAAARVKLGKREEEHRQLLGDLEADKSRLMGYYDEKCLQSDSYKKQIKVLEEQMARLRKEFKAKELEGMALMNEIEADKSRLMGYYDEKCLQIGTYKKQLKVFEQEIARLTSGEGAGSLALQEELAAFKRQMAAQELAPVKTVNVKKEATELVGAVAQVIADYTVEQCVSRAAAALAGDHNFLGRGGGRGVVVAATPAGAFVPAAPAGSADEDLKKIVELEATVAKKNDHIHALVVGNESAESEIRLLKSKLLSGDEGVARLTSEMNKLKDKINELTKENYYSKEENAKLAEQVETMRVELEGLQGARTAAASEEHGSSGGAEHEADRVALREAQSALQALQAATAKSTEERTALVDQLTAEHRALVQEKDAELQRQEETLGVLRKLVTDLKGSKDQLELQVNEMKQDPTLKAKIEKLQALTRGFNARSRVKRTKMHRDAQTSGVLVATKHTTQGDSGWYCAPDGSLYYFVLDAEEWILTCGPITREAFEETVVSLKPKKASSAGYLKVSNFDLVTQTVDQPGELYMSTSTWKLYFAVSVDHLVTENR